MAWGLQTQGVPPAGIVSDSGVVNQEWEVATNQQDVCTEKRDDAALAAIKARTQFQIADINNEPDRLVKNNQLTVPVLHVWNRNDKNTCGSVQMNCPLRNGTVQQLGSAECAHQPLRTGRSSRRARHPSPGTCACA